MTIAVRVNMIMTKLDFVLFHKEFDDMLKEISAVNARLNNLVKVGKELEASRRRGLQWDFACLLRELSGSLFKALDGATVRCCKCPHDVCLRLTLRILEMEPGRGKEEVAKDVDFHVALGLYNTATSGYRIRVPSEWYNLLAIQNSPQEPGQGVSQPEPQSFRQRLRRRTRATRTLIKESVKLILKHLTQLSSGLGLCEMIRAQPMTLTTAVDRVLYGHIQDREIQRFFGLYAPALQQSGNHTHAHNFTLRQMLTRSSGVSSQNDVYPGIDSLGFEGTFQLAVLVAINVLHLFNTPWLSKTISLDDIKFRPRDEAPTTLYSRYSLAQEFGQNFPYRPFISKVMPSSDGSVILGASNPMSGLRPCEMTTSMLGFVLIQIMLKKVIVELDINEDQRANTMTFEECERMCNLGKRYESEVRGAAGPEYASAVMWCLESLVNINGLDNDNFCHEFCDKVISRLQDALGEFR